MSAALLAAAALLVAAAGLRRGWPQRSPVTIPTRPGVGRALRSPLTRFGGDDRQLVAELPSLVEATVRGLRAGLSLPVALVDAGARTGGTVARDLAMVERWMARGFSLVEACTLWAGQRQGVREVQLLVTAVAVAATAGGRAADALEGVGTTLRERAELQRDVRAQAAQARASAVVMVALPVGFLAVTATVDPRVVQILFTTRLGALCLVAGLLLEAGGAFWMRQIITGVGP